MRRTTPFTPINEIYHLEIHDALKVTNYIIVYLDN